jgi:hypothetical protein
MQEFTVDTALDAEAIREACGRAAEAGTRFLDTKVVEYAATDTAIGYVINGVNLLGTQLMDLAVGWEEIGDGRRRVTLEVGDFVTDRWALWGFIPLSPRSPVAMGSLKRFSASLRKELSWMD